MRHSTTNATFRSGALAGLLLAIGLALPALAQEDPAADPAAPPAVEASANGPASEEADPAMATDADIASPPNLNASASDATTLTPSAIPEASLPHDLSPWGMFMQADIVVKAVMIGLAFASLVTWTVWLAKGLELMGASGRAKAALRAITGSRTLDDAIRALDTKRGVGVLLVKAAEEEVQLSHGALDHADGAGLKERVASRLARLTAAAGRRISRGTGLLATIGSTAPFVGLFGTVWGIMNAFIGISEAQTTNLAVVAPGIAEALLATALGLVAAIPAVVIYNVFARSITGYRQLLADAAAGVERLVSRDLDWRLVPAPTGSLRAGRAPAPVEAE
jgi:biopolymer transport protein ExbB